MSSDIYERRNKITSIFKFTIKIYIKARPSALPGVGFIFCAEPKLGEFNSIIESQEK